MLIAVLILFALLIIGFPVYIGLLLSGVYVLVFMFGIPIDMVITSMFDGSGKFSLTAVPFFLLAGCLMEKGSIASRLVGSLSPWLVRMRGGITVTAVAANEVFGAMSGSAPAAAGTIGKAMFPAVSKKNGEDFALGLFASCGALAIIMPPSINMIIFATATNCSVGDLFKAGIIPALIIGLLLSIYIVIKSKPPADDERFNLKYALRMLWKGVPALILPVIVLGGIYGGLFTPTEAGAVSAIYVFFVSALVLKELSGKKILDSLKETIKLTGQIFILIAASTVFSQALTIAQVPELLGQMLSGLNSTTFLLLLNLLLLVVGCFFDPTSAVLILAPIVAPIAASLGINIIHLGIVFTVNLAIGMFTPPFGLNLFVIQSIFKRPMERIAKSIVPFFAVYLVCLIIITYIPQLYLH